jgi:hypothetical protein
VASGKTILLDDFAEETRLVQTPCWKAPAPMLHAWIYTADGRIPRAKQRPAGRARVCDCQTGGDRDRHGTNTYSHCFYIGISSPLDVTGTGRPSCSCRASEQDVIKSAQLRQQVQACRKIVEFFPRRSPPGGYSVWVKGRSMTENPITLDT